MLAEGLDCNHQKRLPPGKNYRILKETIVTYMVN